MDLHNLLFYMKSIINLTKKQPIGESFVAVQCQTMNNCPRLGQEILWTDALPKRAGGPVGGTINQFNLSASIAIRER